MNQFPKLFGMIAIAVCISSCNRPGAAPEASDALASHIDTTVNAREDFFLHANGKWFRENPIPPSEQSNGLWQLIQDTINAQVRSICESAASLANAEKGSNKQKIGDFFLTGMDSIALNREGIGALRSEFAMIDAVKDKKELIKAASYLYRVAAAPMFSFGVGQDDKISSKNAIFISQGGLSLSGRNYYFDTDPRAQKIRQQFVQHVKNMFVLMGYDTARAGRASTNLMKLETAIAKSSRKPEDTRDPVKNYHKITFKKLMASTPNLDWGVFMEGAGLHNVDTVIVGQPEFLTALNGYAASTPMEDWKNYLKYHLVRGMYRYLDDTTYLEGFNFYSTVLRGVAEPKPRWKRVVEREDASLGELIGQVYVNEYLPKGTKDKLLEIGNAIKRVYAERIKALSWMGDATKQKALAKLNSVIMKVGYPDKWKDMGNMTIDRSSFAHNVMNANAWRFDYMIAKFGKPVNRAEWTMEPQTYNAYYNPSNNEIVVPGCNILVPGYERTLADDALLYSIIGGSTFGHEITHGFDDQGSKYDEFGNLHNWWTADDSAKFYARTRMIVRQFNSYSPVDTLHINGELTQGENIADLGGIMMGYEAFKQTEQYKAHQMIGGLDPDQRFFLGYALAWMINDRPEGIANQIRSDPHAPAKYRVIGPLTNMPEFLTTFGIREGDAMYRPESTRVLIW
jgi:putative endopeptidase